MMIEELEGSVAETLRHLASEPLDPRDESRLYNCWASPDWKTTGWSFQGRFLTSGYTFHLRHTGAFDDVRPFVEAMRANTRSPEYVAEWRSLVPHLNDWLAIGRGNVWIRAADDPPFTERSFALCRDAQELARMVDRNNWSPGTAFVLAETDLCMIQQCVGPGEFLMIRGTVAFDSWTTGAPWIYGPKLIKYVEAVLRAPLDETGSPQWYELAEPMYAQHESAPVVVAESAAELHRLLA